MTTEKGIYRKLQEAVDELSYGFPATRSGVEIEILKFLFNEEEANIYLNMGTIPETPETIAERLGLPKEGMAEKLKEMVKKGTLFDMDESNKRVYAVAPFAHGFFENTGHVMTPELADMFERFFQESLFENIRNIPTTTLSRFVPVNESVKADFEMAPVDSVEKFFQEKNKIAVMDCMCKIQQGLIGNPTDKLLEVCFAFEWLADYAVNRGQGRYVSLSEALEIHRKCEDAGLLTNMPNMENALAMCHCCERCLGIRALKMLPRPAESFTHNYYVRVDETLCTGCGTCVERCQIEAVSLNEKDVADINLDRCIGCGVCVPTCPVEAVILCQKPINEQLNERVDPNAAAQMIAEARGKAATPFFHQQVE
jgi:Na+-translocating ferredoxin:NAD+ oxidoreductase subunit B